ncbi:unnamed protein product [Polarella glacialis]|uniref:Glutamate-5-semialdehyde dehydrogenase n=1 Tax=Polarella glacialis TaxID=89957 RepID=A0A813KXB4_POLGL|nr:unnamed protein product [Polarella glacialis]
MEDVAKRARAAAQVLGGVSLEVKNKALEAFKRHLVARRAAIEEANALDMAAAEAAVKDGKLSSSLFKRLDVSGAKFDSLLAGIDDIIKLPDPVGQITYANKVSEGLNLYRMTCPIGVLLIIYEARPDAGVQIAALAMKSGNALLLKGGKEAQKSNEALISAMAAALSEVGLPADCIQGVDGRTAVAELLSQDKYIDLVIPRGSNELSLATPMGFEEADFFTEFLCHTMARSQASGSGGKRRRDGQHGQSKAEGAERKDLDRRCAKEHKAREEHWVQRFALFEERASCLKKGVQERQEVYWAKQRKTWHKQQQQQQHQQQQQQQQQQQSSNSQGPRTASTPKKSSSATTKATATTTTATARRLQRLGAALAATEDEEDVEEVENEEKEDVAKDYGGEEETAEEEAAEVGAEDVGAEEDGAEEVGEDDTFLPSRLLPPTSPPRGTAKSLELRHKVKKLASLQRYAEAAELQAAARQLEEEADAFAMSAASPSGPWAEIRAVEEKQKLQLQRLAERLRVERTRLHEQMLGELEGEHRRQHFSFQKLAARQHNQLQAAGGDPDLLEQALKKIDQQGPTDFLARSATSRASKPVSRPVSAASPPVSRPVSAASPLARSSSQPQRSRPSSAVARMPVGLGRPRPGSARPGSAAKGAGRASTQTNSEPRLRPVSAALKFFP